MKHLPLNLSIVLFTFVVAVNGQEDFEDLSTKERIEIASQEETQAVRDAEFQKIMQAGHQLFKDQHYLKAINKYKQAREARPYNVYPKVIIADIELSMKDTLKTLRAANKENETKEKPEQKTKEPEQDEMEPGLTTETKDERMEKLNNWEEEERARRERERERAEKNEQTQKSEPAAKTGDVKQLSTADFQKELAEKYPDGITEEIEQKGNKTIITRIVVKNGKGNEYKKVEHNWGGVFYFKNGDAVTDRVWKKETE